MEIEAYIINKLTGETRGVFLLENYNNRVVWRFSRYVDANVTRTVMKSNQNIIEAVRNVQSGWPLILPFKEKDLEWK
jgi:hypothetical protein